MKNKAFELNGLRQPLDAVCEVLEQQGKGIFATSLRDIYNIALLTPNLEQRLQNATTVILGKYPSTDERYINAMKDQNFLDWIKTQ
jgi:hypothetical protein